MIQRKRKVAGSMKKIISSVLIITLIVIEMCSFASCGINAKQKFTEYYFDYFDTVTIVIGYEKTEEEFKSVTSEIEKQLKEYHQLYNIYNSYEGINNICALNRVKDGTHQKLKVDKKIIDLLMFSKKIYGETKGVVNVAMGSVLSIWHDYRNEGLNNIKAAKLPPMDMLRKAEAHTSISDLIIDEENQTVFLNDPEMTLDVGAIAKGYTVERIGEYLVSQGKTGYLLNVGGNVKAVSDSENESFEVGVENPDKDEDESYIERLTVTDESIVTSGTYQRFYVVDGKRYHHLIDPNTLMPGENFKSVSVIMKDSSLADAYSTALFLMDYEEGKEFIKDKTDVKVIWVDNNGNILKN